MGNKVFREGRDKDALRLYTESVATACPDTPELSLAFANRSAALYRLGNCFDSLRDINRSLALPCPEAIRTKLLKRKQACLIRVEEDDRVKSNLLVSWKLNCISLPK